MDYTLNQENKDKNNTMSLGLSYGYCVIGKQSFSERCNIALKKFRERFSLEPTFIAVHPSVTDMEFLDNIKIIKRSHIMKNDILLGLE